MSSKTRNSKCFFCAKLVSSEEYYCYGCKQVTCLDCSINDHSSGSHSVYNHLQPSIYNKEDAIKFLLERASNTLTMLATVKKKK